MEEELRRSRQQLQATIENQEASNEELKASNEELQSINEELQSATEELETSKEELQSMNEELTTVNQELRLTVDDAARSNADLRNLLAATGIGTVYLDRALRLKRYTPGAADIFHVIPSDLGRPFGHLTHRLLGVDLPVRAEQVLATLVPQEEEIQSDDGAWFLARIIPYRTADDRIDGVVLSFVAITEQKRARDEASRRAEQQAAVAEIGRLALADLPVDVLFERAVEVAASGIGADFAKVLRHRPEHAGHGAGGRGRVGRGRGDGRRHHGPGQRGLAGRLHAPGAGRGDRGRPAPGNALCRPRPAARPRRAQRHLGLHPRRGRQDVRRARRP